MKTIFMFSGQGSQYYNMGRKLFDSDDNFRRDIYELDEIVRSVKGLSVVNELYNPKYKLFDPFIKLSLSHPAIFMVEYALFKMLERQGIVPDYVLGCSLGEFAAATVAGVISKEVALKLVLKQAEIIEHTCIEGRMIAVLMDLNTYNDHPVIRNNSTMASVNSPAQFVVSGEYEKMNQVKNFMKENDMLHQELMVSYGFHSSAVDHAEDLYKAYLNNQSFASASIPLISGVSGAKLNRLSADYFWDVVRKPTLFVDAINTVENSINIEEDLMYIDLGPAGSLANLIKYNVKKGSRSIGFQIMSPFQQEIKKLEEVKNYYKDRKKEEVMIHIPAKDKPLLAYVFPGQGSQKKGMGENLFDIFPKHTESASEILGYSIKEFCLENPNRNLNLTQFTQPALYVVNALSYLKLKEETGILPDFVAGHSLGEFNALFAAGAFDFETGLRLVQKRGDLMAKMKEGGMAAVKGLTSEEIREIIERNGLDEIDMANFNAENQIVISGPRALIAKSGSYFEAAGATLYFPLNVSGAFHSRYMLPAKEAFEVFLNQFQFSPLQIPVVSNVEASFYPGDKIKHLLANQLVKPVRWRESVAFLMKKGEVNFKEVGPGDVLTKLIWRIFQDMKEPAL